MFTSNFDRNHFLKILFEFFSFICTGMFHLSNETWLLVIDNFTFSRIMCTMNCNDSLKKARFEGDIGLFPWLNFEGKEKRFYLLGFAYTFNAFIKRFRERNKNLLSYFGDCCRTKNHISLSLSLSVLSAATNLIFICVLFIWAVFYQPNISNLILVSFHI